MQSLRLKIGGMHCDGCAVTNKSLLEHEAGVRMVDVSFKDGTARVLYDPATVSEEALSLITIRRCRRSTLRRSSSPPHV